jgi:hypothetical protein
MHYVALIVFEIERNPFAFLWLISTVKLLDAG